MTMIRSMSVGDMHEEPEIIFSGFVKKLSRNFRIWQQRIITLNALGDIYITKVHSKDTVTFSSNSLHHKNASKPPINVALHDIPIRQGVESDGKWPAKLDLRQSLVLGTIYPKFIYFPSIRAAEALRTQTHILQLRQRAFKENESRDSSIKRRDAMRKKEAHKEEEKHIVHSMLNLTELGKFAENVKHQLIEKSETVQSQEEGDRSSCEVSLDFEVRENLVSCKVSHSLEDIAKIGNEKTQMSPELKKLSKGESNEFKPKPILKKQDFFCYKSKKKVQFDSAQAFRISTPANPRSVQLDWQNVILPNFYRQVRKHSFDAVYVI